MQFDSRNCHWKRESPKQAMAVAANLLATGTRFCFDILVFLDSLHGKL